MTPATPSRQWSLRYELTRVLVIASLLPALVFGVALLWNQWQRAEGDLQVRLAANAQLSASAIDDFMQGQLSGVRLAADGIAAEDQAAAGLAMRQRPAPGNPVDGVAPDGELAGDLAIGESLDHLLRAYPAMRQAIVTDADGAIAGMRTGSPLRIGGGANPSADRGGLPVTSKRRTPHISDGYRSTIDGSEALVAASAPLVREGRFSGMLHAAIPIDRFTRLRSDSLSLRGFELLVLDTRNHVIHAGRGLRWQFAAPTEAVGVEIRREATPLGRIGRSRRLVDALREGGDAYVHAVSLPTGWIVAVVAPAPRMLAPSLARVGLLLGLLMVTLLCVMFSLWRLRRLLTENMGLLLASLQGYALGGAMDPGRMARLPQELQPLAKGIGDLAARMNTAFGELREALDQREHAIAERTASLHEAVGELDRLSRTDALTGSLNYRGFQEAAERLWQEARAAGAGLAVLALDIDHFKRYNDLYGHSGGDGALRRFAGAVRSALLRADDVLGRPGGEEFIVFLPGSTFQQAMQVAERVCQRVRDADIVHTASPEGRVTVSIGVSAMDADDAEAEDVLKRADAALYRAKHAGRNRVSD